VEGPSAHSLEFAAACAHQRGSEGRWDGECDPPPSAPPHIRRGSRQDQNPARIRSNEVSCPKIASVFPPSCASRQSGRTLLTQSALALLEWK